MQQEDSSDGLRFSVSFTVCLSVSALPVSGRKNQRFCLYHLTTTFEPAPSQRTFCCSLWANAYHLLQVFCFQVTTVGQTSKLLSISNSILRHWKLMQVLKARSSKIGQNILAVLWWDGKFGFNGREKFMHRNNDKMIYKTQLVGKFFAVCYFLRLW